jgi:hypothetical protein
MLYLGLIEKEPIIADKLFIQASSAFVEHINRTLNDTKCMRAWL